MHKYVFALLIVASPFPALAGELPKEGNYDFTSCWSGVSSGITFSKTYTGSSYELTGTSRSNPPGGLYDKSTFRCVGMNTSFDGKNTSSPLCEIIDVDGDKELLYFLFENDVMVTRTNVTGTGKYEGIVAKGTLEQLGPFPAIKAGTFQGCNHQAGTYKLK